MNRAILVAGAAALGAAMSFADGVSLVVQDDYFTGTDRGYTDGTELMWNWSPADTNGALIQSTIGARNRMYTPDSIDAHQLLPMERPYCATLSAFYQIWRREDVEKVKYELEAGVLGPDAYGDQLQSWSHRAIGYKVPQGWDDQLRPDEPLLNAYMERWHPLDSIGEPHSWQAQLDGLYGGALGTTFINGVGGFNGRAGWNMPENMAGRTVLSNPARDFYAFAFVEPRGRLVLFNATLGNSMFDDRDNERRLLPLVGEIEGGIVLGWRGFSLTYSAVESSREFRHQNHKQSYGNIRVDYTWCF